MTPTKANLLIVEDDATTGKILSIVLANSGYRVRWATDGFAGLAEIRKEIPEILLSDLNMSGMSGFEMLSVVRRRFASIQVVAMSATFSGTSIPSGVAADAFYEKGTHIGFLLHILGNMAPSEQTFLQRRSALTPVWIPSNGNDSSGQPYVLISCPECMRPFSHVLRHSVATIQEALCVHCSSTIPFAMVPPESTPGDQPIPGAANVEMRKPPEGASRPLMDIEVHQQHMKWRWRV